MADKVSYNEIQSLGNDKAKILRIVLISIVGIVVITIGIAFARSFLTKPEEEVVPETITTQMLPSTIKYYDPAKEESYETGSNFIVIADGSARIRVDADGNADYVTEDGMVTGHLEGEAKTKALDTAISIMQNDRQVGIALDGLTSEEPEVEPPKALTREELLASILAEMGISVDEFYRNVYNTGSTLEDVYTMFSMVPDEETVINAIMEKGKVAEETAESTPAASKALSVSVEKIGAKEDVAVPVENVSSEIEYPAWMQEQDLSAPMTAILETLASATAPTSETSETRWEQVNQQTEKQNWVEKQQTVETVSGQISKYDLVAGTVVPITLVTGLNTDLPGEVIGLVRQDVYDTLTGGVVLIPKGTRLLATYNNSVSFGQKSVQIAWQQMITPDGYIFSLPGFQGITPEGFSGVSDKYESHFWSILGGAVLGSIIDYGASELSKQAKDAAKALGPTSSAITAVSDASINTVATIGQQYTSQWANRQPTIIIRPGAQMQLLVNQTISLKRVKYTTSVTGNSLSNQM